MKLETIKPDKKEVAIGSSKEQNGIKRSVNQQVNAWLLNGLKL
jgi:hypothetical protein